MSSRRSKKACTECRQQKAKCDAYLRPDEPCSRCRKVNAQCVILPPFKREHKRKRLSELENEANDLRRQLRTSESNHGLPNSIAVSTAPAETSMGALGNQQEHFTPVSASGYQPTYLQASLTPITPERRHPSENPSRSGEPTLPRTLNGKVVEGYEIDDMFELYFRHFHDALPILDSRTCPNSYYMQSELLFWMVIGVSSRSYQRNPTLFSALCFNIRDLALLSAGTNSSPLCKLQAFLLLLTWPFPSMDVMLPISGLMLHLAMQNGLHIPVSSQDFAGMKRTNLTEMDVNRRAEVWGYCIVIYQRTCLCKGQPGRPLLDLAPDSDRNLFRRLPSILRLQIKCLDTATRCSCAVFENGVRSMSTDQERALNILLRTFEHELDDRERRLETMNIFQGSFPPASLFLTMCRLHVQVFYLYRTQYRPTDGCFARLLSTACDMIDQTTALTQREGEDCYTAVPFGISHAVVLASACLLRLLKTSMSRDLDVEKARSYFFTSITMMKRLSIEATDMPARCAALMNQLWNSSKVFKKPDGSEHTALRIRSRLVTGPVMDAIWWWRQEFDPHHKQLFPGGDIAAPMNTDLNRDTNLGPSVQSHPVDFTVRQESFPTIGDDFFADFEWSLGMDCMFPTSESFAGMTWSMTPNATQEI